MNLQRIIDAVQQEFGEADLAINVHANGERSIHVPRADVYLTSTCPYALYLAVRGHVRKSLRGGTVGVKNL